MEIELIIFSASSLSLRVERTRNEHWETHARTEARDTKSIFPRKGSVTYVSRWAIQSPPCQGRTAGARRCWGSTWSCGRRWTRRRCRGRSAIVWSPWLSGAPRSGSRSQTIPLSKVVTKFDCVNIWIFWVNVTFIHHLYCFKPTVCGQVKKDEGNVWQNAWRWKIM